MKRILVLTAFIILSTVAFSQKQISLNDIGSYMGDSVSFSGTVSGLRYLSASNGSPTLINLGGMYPNQMVTVVIWGNVRNRFSPELTEENLKGKTVKVTGVVSVYKAKPQVVVYGPSQFQLVEEPVKQ